MKSQGPYCLSKVLGEKMKKEVIVFLEHWPGSFLALMFSLSSCFLLSKIVFVGNLK